MKRTTRWSLALCGVCIAAVLAANGMVEGKGKPDKPGGGGGGGGGGEEPARVNFEIEFLGSLGGTPGWIQVWDTNNQGDVVGMSFNADGNTRAFLSVASGDQLHLPMVDLNDQLPAGSGWVLNHARGINDQGQVTGTGRLNGVFGGYRFTPATANASAFISLLTPLTGDEEAIGLSINNSGAVLAISIHTDGTQRGVVYDAITLTPTLIPGISTDSDLDVINDSGEVTGSTGPTAANADPRAFRFAPTSGTTTIIEPIAACSKGTTFSRGESINNDGVVVGNSDAGERKGRCIRRAFAYKDGVLTDLGTLGGDQSGALAINNTADIVGWSDLPKNASSSRGSFILLADDGVMRQLEPLVTNYPSDAVGSIGPMDVNDKQGITGHIEVRDADGSIHREAIYLRPVPPQ